MEAALQAVREEMRNDSRVFVMGEDVQSGLCGDYGLAEFGTERVRNTPICEAGFFGAAIGAALTGMRPVIETGASNFLYSAMDQIANQAAKSCYMFGGQSNVPIVIRSTISYTVATAAHHSDRPWGLFAQVPGLKIIVPTTPHDAKGLLKAAIRDGNPVLCFDDMTLMGKIGEVPATDYTVPLGKAEVRRLGNHLTIVALGAAVDHSLAAAEILENDAISAEVIDVRSVVPLDRRTILESIEKTGRLLAVDAAPGTCGLAAEIAAIAAQHAFRHLKGPVMRLTAPDVPVPFSPALERLMYPTVETITIAARTLFNDT